MKLLHVIWHLGQGGAQTYLYNLLKVQVMDAELLPQLLVLSGRGPLSDQFEGIVDVSYLNMRSGLDILRATQIRSALVSANVELIHSHSNNLLFNATLQFMKVPVVWTEHGGVLRGRKRDFLIYRFLSRPISRFIAISQVMAKTMVEVRPSLRDRIDVVYNGIDAEAVAALPVSDGDELDARILKARFRVGIVGRLEYQKGVDHFIAAAVEMCNICDEVAFVIIGDGSLRTQLEKVSRDSGFSDKIFFLGYRADALRLVKMLDVFLFTSNYEPFGLVITEAMASGVPVVAMHARGAVPEIISDGYDGLIVIGERPRELASAVIRLLSDPRLKSEIVGNAAQTVRQRFSIEENASGVMRTYKKCFPLDQFRSLDR